MYEDNRSSWGGMAAMGAGAGYMGWRNWSGIKRWSKTVYNSARGGYASGGMWDGIRAGGAAMKGAGRAAWGATRGLPGAVNAAYNAGAYGGYKGAMWGGLRSAARRLFVG